ncbi:hypothetical protein Trydic_g10034 [Trypoxylus dichotomus]
MSIELLCVLLAFVFRPGTVDSDSYPRQKRFHITTGRSVTSFNSYKTPTHPIRLSNPIRVAYRSHGFKQPNRNNQLTWVEPLALSRKASAQNHDELSPALQSTKSHVLQRGSRRHQGKAQREVAVTRAVSLVPSPAALFGANQRRNGHASAVLNASTVCGGNLTAATTGSAAPARGPG